MPALLSSCRRHRYPFALIICSACLREVSVSLAPLSMRATSSVRSSPDDGADRGSSAATALFLLDHVVMIGEGGDLREVSHAEHLVGSRASAFSFLPTASAARPPMPVSISSKTMVRWAAGRARGFRGRERLCRTVFAGTSRLYAYFQREHHARQFSSGRDVLQLPHGLAWIRRDHVNDLIDSGLRPVPFLLPPSSSRCGTLISSPDR